MKNFVLKNKVDSIIIFEKVPNYQKNLRKFCFAEYNERGKVKSVKKMGQKRPKSQVMHNCFTNYYFRLSDYLWMKLTNIVDG